MIKSFKVRLELNNKQITYAKKHCGVSRHAYNWGLDMISNQLERNKIEKKEKFYTAIDLHKLLVSTVKKENPWYYEVSKCTPQEALRNLEKAFKNCFLHKHTKFPIRKKKGNRDSFYLENPNSFLQIDKNKIKIPKFGWIKCSEAVPDVKFKSVVISRTADEWFMSFKYEIEPIKLIGRNESVGVDLGIKTLATLSDGVEFENKKAYRRHKRKLRIAQRKVSKKFIKGQKQSNNYKKAKQKVAKIHQKIANVRKDSIHKLTTYLVKNHDKIIIEDLNVQGMSKNHKLASAILDCGFGMFRSQLEYKSKLYGSELIVIDRFFPSSKTCSECGNIKKDLTLNDRVYKCDNCKHEQNRDLNAAINIKNYTVSSTVNACGALQQQTINNGLKRYETRRKHQSKKIV